MTYEEFEVRYEYNPATDQIGQGGFGQVYKAYDTIRKRWVAIKECKVEPNKFSLEREVRLVAELGPHKHIARYENNYRFKLGRIEIDYAVMQYYEQGSLHTVMAKHKLKYEEIKEITEGLLQGLSYIHQEGFIHRDFKPGNILMHREKGSWVPKITDFGMSKIKTGTNEVTNDSAIAKTLAYAAPEQIQNRPIKENTDLWALGVTIYKLCTGSLPFDSNATTSHEIYNIEVSKQIISAKLPNLNGIHDVFKSIIERCLVVDMDKRAQKATDLLVLLKEYRASFITDEEVTSQVNNEIENVVESPFSSKDKTTKTVPFPFTNFKSGHTQENIIIYNQLLNDSQSDISTQENSFFIQFWDSKGRTRRKDFVIGMVLIHVIFFGSFIMISILKPDWISNRGIRKLFLSWGVVGFFLIIPALSITLRRMHDIGKSAWLLLIPFYRLYLLLQDSQPGPNEWGPNPKGVDN